MRLHRSQETSHSTSSNRGGRGRRPSMNNHYTFCNCGSYVDIGISRSQDTRHYSSHNLVARVDVELEVDMGIDPANISPRTNANVVYC